MKLRKKYIIILIVLLLIITIGLIFFWACIPGGKGYETTLNLNEKQGINCVMPGQYIELVDIDLDKRTATFLGYDKSATKESDKYRFTIEEGDYQGVSVSHCELIDVSVLKIESSTVTVNIKRKSGCVS